MSRQRRLKVVVEADGGARGNPGPAGYGAVIREAATGETLVERLAAIGVATNNVAEYSGLIAGLQAAADLGAVEVEVRMDSKLVVEQMSGRWQIKHPGLRPLAAQAATLVRRFDTVRFVWVPRERNRRADALANAAMDGRDPPEPDLARGDVAAGDVAAGDVAAGDVAGPQVLDWHDRPAVWAAPADAPVTQLILVRHGETQFTVERRYSGRSDVELTEHGVVQSQAVAARVANLIGSPEPDSAIALYSSPLARCLHTADLIAVRLGAVPVRVDPDLIECDFGEWEGQTFGDVRQRWPDELERWLSSPAVAAPGGESIADVAVRVRSAQRRLLAAAPGGSVVVVSHVTPIKLILRDALAAGDAFLYRSHLDPAGISIVDLRPGGSVLVRCINDTAHVVS